MKPFTRLPPHSEDAERSLLGAILLEGDVLTTVLPLVKAEDFYATAHQRIFEACAHLLHEGSRRIDPVLIKAELERRGDIKKVGGEAYLAQLAAQVPSAAGAPDYARIVSEKAVKRNLVHVCTQIQSVAYEGRQPGHELLDWAEAQVFALARSTASSLHPPFDEGDDPVDSLAIAKGGIRLPIPGLDISLIDDLVLVGGQPSVGKSTLIVQIADEMNRAGVHVLVFPAEQSRRKWEAMSLARRTGANSRRLLDGNVSDKVREKLRAAQAAWLPTVQQYRRYAGSFPSPVRLVQEVERRHAALGDARLVVIIDALHNLRESGLKDRRVEIDAITDMLRQRVCQRLGVPLIATSHLNRDGEFKESGGLDYAGDILVLLERREDRPKETTIDGDSQTVRRVKVTVRKSRDGDTPSTTLDFLPASRQFRISNAEEARNKPGPAAKLSAARLIEAIDVETSTRHDLAKKLGLDKKHVERAMETAEFLEAVASGKVMEDKSKGPFTYRRGGTA